MLDYKKSLQVVLGEGSIVLDYEEKAFRWSLMRIHSHENMKGKPSEKSGLKRRVASQKSGLKRRVASHQCISVRAVFHQGGLSLGWSFCCARGLTIPVNLE